MCTGTRRHTMLGSSFTEYPKITARIAYYYFVFPVRIIHAYYTYMRIFCYIGYPGRQNDTHRCFKHCYNIIIVCILQHPIKSIGSLVHADSTWRVPSETLATKTTAAWHIHCYNNITTPVIGTTITCDDVIFYTVHNVRFKCTFPIRTNRISTEDTLQTTKVVSRIGILPIFQTSIPTVLSCIILILDFEHTMSLCCINLFK